MKWIVLIMVGLLLFSLVGCSDTQHENIKKPSTTLGSAKTTLSFEVVDKEKVGGKENGFE